MKYNVLIFDCYNIFYKANWIEEERLVRCDNRTVHTEGILGFFKAVGHYIKEFGTEDAKVFWLMDNATTSVSRFRKDLSEDYKATRKEQPEWFYRELDFVELILKYYRNNSELYRLKFLEADDYVSNIISLYVKPTDNVLMISEDSDWCRNLSDNVHQYKDHRIYTKKVFFEQRGFEATYSNICFDKTFYGDKTDNILPSLPNLPKAFFLEVISEFKTANDFIQAVKSNPPAYLDKGWQLKILKEQNKILLNWNLVESADIGEKALDIYGYKCCYKPEKLKIIYASLGLLDKIDERVKTKNDSGGDVFSMLEGENLSRSVD